MPTIAQLISVIRFHLHELKAQNAHHDFEHLCRHLTRLRVYSNVLPATGPVGAGGDAGRDFETFSTFAVPLPGSKSDFFDRSSGPRKVAFGCSLQEQIEKKIESDVASITTGGAVDEVVYFCEQDLAVSKRRRLENWASETENVVLQVFDGQAIAELLSAPDTVWIAQEYLRIPAELFPQSATDADWYNASLKRWKGREPLPFSQANLVEIKHALRWATAHDDSRRDFPFWMNLLERYLEDDTPRVIRRTAMYELAVASLRAKGEMTSKLALMGDYYSDLEDWVRIADLQDAAMLLLRAFGAWSTGRLAIEPERLFQWRSRLADCLDTNIAHAVGPGWRCGLREIRGYLCIMPPQDRGIPPIDEGFEIWAAMLNEIDRAPLFPLEAFADFLTQTTSVLGHHPRFRELTERIDDKLVQ